MSDSDGETEKVVETKPVRKKREMTDEQRATMLLNLEKGRKKRHELMKNPNKKSNKKENKKTDDNVVLNVKDIEDTAPPKNNEDVNKVEEVVKDKIETKPKKRGKKQKIVLQVDSDSSSDEDAIIIKTKRGRKNKKVDPIPPPSPLLRTQQTASVPVATPQIKPKPELTAEQKAKVLKNRQIETAMLKMKSSNFMG